MTVKSIPCYYVECDNCGDWNTDGGEYACWADQVGAEEEALAVGWKPLTYGRWLCEECRLTEELAEEAQCPDPPEVTG